MKKIFLFILMMIIGAPLSVRADNVIYDIDIDIYINEDGTANITEEWDVDGEDGTEWYKVIKNSGNSELSNFTVSMDGKLLEYKEWKIGESIEQKKGYYGINYIENGMELCFGKYDYERHTFVLNYTLSNFVFNTSDSQVLYWTLIDKLDNVNFKNFSVTISSYYVFPDTLDVWGYGYKGYAYVKNGKISMSNIRNMSDEYVTLLVKFPFNTFNTINSVNNYNSFDDVYNRVEEGTFDYDYTEEDNNNDQYDNEKTNNLFIKIVLLVIAVVFGIYLGSKPPKKKKKKKVEKYVYVDNKRIIRKNVPLFRDIPCNKDIYYANVLIKLNNFGYDRTHIIGAIILKWVRNKKVIFVSKKEKDKKKVYIDLTVTPDFDNKLEKRLFNIMYEASFNGILEEEEFGNWCRKNNWKVLNLLNDFYNDTFSDLKNKDLISVTRDKEKNNKKYVMSLSLYEDSVKLYGLKKYLLCFSKIEKKVVHDVFFWDEYLMFAYLFGIADLVYKQLKKMYPKDFVEFEFISNNTIDYIDRFSYRMFESVGGKYGSYYNSDYDVTGGYSSGGGGFSSGGGGGGSFGGGGGGSR